MTHYLPVQISLEQVYPITITTTEHHTIQSPSSQQPFPLPLYELLQPRVVQEGDGDPEPVHQQQPLLLQYIRVGGVLAGEE